MQVKGGNTMKINIGNILQVALDDNDGELFGLNYFIKENGLFGNTLNNKKVYFEMIYLPECDGIEILDDRILIYEAGELELLINKNGCTYPDNNLRKLNHDLLIYIVESGQYSQYKEDSKKSTAQLLEEIKELEKESHDSWERLKAKDLESIKK